MPNINPTLGYVRKMRAQEVKYLAEINAARIDFRRAALDILMRYGIKISVFQDIQREIYALEQRVTASGRENAALLDELVIWYANQQLGSLRKAGETGLPTVQQANLGTYALRQEVYRGTIIGTPAWIGDMARSLETNITRLAVTGSDIQPAVNRLLSVSIQDGRASVYRLSGAAAATETQTVAWMAAAGAMFAFYKHVSGITQREYSHQAIAAIDQNTTDCCLQVHGQIQPLNKPFILHGTPRFADKLDSSPFHWNCRTAISLYTQRMEDIGITTAEMKAAADAEQQARKEKSTAKTWPIYSTSRRN